MCFKERVNTAAQFISSGRETTRRFDGCFECFDGDAVAVALYRRAKKRPNTKLAAGLWKYLHRPTVISAAWQNRGRVNLEEWSIEMISSFGANP